MGIEENRNKILINYDPYKKEIVYHIWDREKNYWREPTKESDFSKSEYQENVSLQNKIHDILAEIDKHYNHGTEPTEIIFEGTDDDFNYIQPIIEKHKCPKHPKIHLIKGDLYLDSAEDVLPEIKKHYSEVEELLKKSPNKDVEDEIKRYTEAAEPIVSICVMGLYSSGKSAFINALIGKEILPSAIKPTTAKNYKITLGNKDEIGFKCCGEDIKLSFKDEIYQTNKTGELPIIQELQNIVEEKSNAENRMYRALKIINDNNDETFSDLIEVEVSPSAETVLPVDKCKFVIYDTPGSDAGSIPKHIEVLKESLKGQTNGLPVFVTTPDGMDRVSNGDLIKLINETGNALDITNTIIVINKADTMANNPFEDQLESERKPEVMKLSSRICFVSSIAGLGSKKANQGSEDSWTDATYDLTYSNIKAQFAIPENKFYKQLYTYNIMPENRLEDYCKKNVKDTIEASKLIHINSGLHFIEDEIGEFARNFALYNKCASASKYLGNAVNLTVQQMKQKRDKLTELSDELDSLVETKHRALLNNLHTLPKDKVPQICREFTEYMRQVVLKHMSNNSRNTDIIQKIETTWKANKDKKKHEREEAINRRLRTMLIEAISYFQSDAERQSFSFWHDIGEKQFKDACLKIVFESEYLNAQEKEKLNEYFMQAPHIFYPEVKISARSLGAYKKPLGIFPAVFNSKLCASGYEVEVNKALGGFNQKIIDEYNAAFDNWCKDLVFLTQEKIAEWNPELSNWSAKIKSYREECEQLEEQQRFLHQHQNNIQELMEFKGRDVNG